MNRRSSTTALASLTLGILALACSNGSTGPDYRPLVGTLETPLPDVLGRPFGVAVSRTGSIHVTSQDLNQVMHLPPEGVGARDSTAVGGDPGDVVITADGSTAIVSTFNDGDLHFLSTATGDQTDFTTIGPNAYRLALSAEGSRVFVTTTGGKVYAVSVATGDKVDSVTLTGSLQGIARRKDGRIAVSSSAGAVTLLDPATLDVITSTQVGPGAQDIAFSRSGKLLFVAREGALAIEVLNGATLASVGTIPFEGDNALLPFGMGISPDGQTLVVAAAGSGRIALVDVPTRTIRAVFDVGGTPRRVAFNATGNRAYVTNEANRVDVLH